MTGMADIHLSMMSNQTNERMKVLTVFATFFLPLTFITGIYGMNFQIMPELAWPWGYPAVLVFMGLLVGGMVWYFKHKRWI